VLSLSTAGAHCHWQDSGFFLAGVKDLGILYPPGFVLYLLLAKAWTLLFSFLDFTYAVHLFSSACAATAAAAIGLAGRELVRRADADGVAAAGAGATAGSLAASGYSFWMAGIYAKPYALLYAVLALLLWRMLRARQTRSPRDLTIVALLIGLAWQAHPSATLAGGAFVAFVAAEGRALGVRGVAARAGLAAAAALLPSLLLPFLSAREPAVRFAEIAGLGDVFGYLTGERFVGQGQVFRGGADRWGTLVEYFREEFLPVGLILGTVGLALLIRRDRALAVGLALWVVPYTLVATTFGIEGQQDHWYVAAWLPLHLATARAAAELWRRKAAVAAAVGVAGVAWAAVSNHSDLDQRRYDSAEVFAECLLKPLPPAAVLIVGADDAASTTFHAQRIRGLRPDVLVVRASHLGAPWYERTLPPLTERGRGKGLPPLQRNALDFAFSMSAAGRPVFLDLPLPEMPERASFGSLFRIGPGAPVFERVAYPVEPEAVRSTFRRARGVRPELPDGTRPREPYERRLLIFLLRAKLHEAEAAMKARKLPEARAAFETVVRADPEAAGLVEVAFPLGSLLYAEGRGAEAEPWFRRALDGGPNPSQAALSWLHLGLIRRAAGDAERAKACFERARGVPGAPPAVLRAVQENAAPR
jgi:hypothetical protein